MPYLGRRDSDYAEMGISNAATTTVGTAAELADRAGRVVDRLAHDAADRHLLLEVLGLVPTEHALAAAG